MQRTHAPRVMAVALAAGGLAGLVGASDVFEKPFRIKADGAFLDVGEIGHAAPFLTDWDNDGDRDLLVGIFGDQSEGKLKIYENIAAPGADPVYGAPQWFMAGGDIGRVPVG